MDPPNLADDVVWIRQTWRIGDLELSTKGVVTNAVLDDNELSVLEGLNSLHVSVDVLNTLTCANLDFADTITAGELLNLNFATESGVLQLFPYIALLVSAVTTLSRESEVCGNSNSVYRECTGFVCEVSSSRTLSSNSQDNLVTSSCVLQDQDTVLATELIAFARINDESFGFVGTVLDLEHYVRIRINERLAGNTCLDVIDEFAFVRIRVVIVQRSLADGPLVNRGTYSSKVKHLGVNSQSCYNSSCKEEKFLHRQNVF